MAQAYPNTYFPAQFIVDYYKTYCYKRSNISSFYETAAMIYRQSWKKNAPLPINQCSDSLFFSNEGDHITVLNYTILPLQFGFLIVINGQIDSPDGRQAFFNQVLQIQVFGYYRLIIADYCAFTGQPLTVQPPTEYFDVYDPNEVANSSEIPKQDEKINSQPEQPKQQVPLIQQSQQQQQQQPPLQQQQFQQQSQQQPLQQQQFQQQSQQQQPLQQQQFQQQPQQQQQQQHDYNNNNGGRGKDGYRQYNNYRGRGRGANRTDSGSREMPDKYSSSNKYVYNAQSAQKYVPPTQNNK